MRLNESLRITVYVRPCDHEAVDVRTSPEPDDWFDEPELEALSSASAPGVPTSPATVAEHNDINTALFNRRMLRFTGSGIGDPRSRLERFPGIAP